MAITRDFLRRLQDRVSRVRDEIDAEALGLGTRIHHEVENAMNQAELGAGAGSVDFLDATAFADHFLRELDETARDVASYAEAVVQAELGAGAGSGRITLTLDGEEIECRPNSVYFEELPRSVMSASDHEILRAAETYLSPEVQQDYHGRRLTPELIQDLLEELRAADGSPAAHGRLSPNPHREYEEPNPHAPRMTPEEVRQNIAHGQWERKDWLRGADFTGSFEAVTVYLKTRQEWPFWGIWADNAPEAAHNEKGEPK